MKLKDVFIHLLNIGLIIFVGSIVYHNVLFSTGPSFQENDLSGMFFPVFYFVKQALISGQFPFWDPYQLLGQPMAFNAYPILYPPVFFFLSLPFKEFLPRHLELFIVFHMIFAGITMYISAQKLGISKWGSLIAATIFLCAPSTSNFIYNPPAALLIPWIPLALVHTFLFFTDPPTENQKMNFFIATVSIALIFLAMSPPIFLYTYLTIGIIGGFLFLNYLLQRKPFSVFFGLIKKILLILIVPTLLTFFVTLPLYTYLAETARNVAAPQNTNVGPLYFAHIWTLLFPKFAYAMSDSFAYIGILPFFVVLFGGIVIGRSYLPKKIALFSLLASFWFAFAIEGSPLYKLVTHLPFMSSLRFSHRAVLFFVIFISFLAGIMVDYFGRFVHVPKKQRTKLEFLFHLLLPLVIIGSLSISYGYFVEVAKSHPLFTAGSYIGYFITRFKFTLLGIVFLIMLFVLKNKVSKLTFINHLFWILPFAIIVFEYSTNYSINPVVSMAAPFYPYENSLNFFKERFPEIINDKNSFGRIENFAEESIFPYYFKQYSVNGVGLIAQATHPRSYYFLWSKTGEWYGHTYRKPTLDTILTTTRIDSPLYRLVGTKYFVTADASSRVVPFEERGKKEYVELIFHESETLSAIILTHSKNMTQRRIGRVSIFANNIKVGEFSLKNIPGPQTIALSLFTNNVKIIAEEVFTNGFPATDGITLEEISFLNSNGLTIGRERIKEIKPSSTFIQTTPENLFDGTPSTWESGNIFSTRTLAEKSRLTYIKDGLYIDKKTLPRSFIVSDYEIVKTQDVLLDKLHWKNFDPSKKVIIYQPDPKIRFPERSDNYQAATIKDYHLNKVTIGVHTEKPGILVLSDMYSQGWSAFVNGKKSPVFNVYGTLRGVVIPEKGTYEVVFQYLPPHLFKGLFVSGVTLVLLFYFSFLKPSDTGKTKN